MMTASRPGKPYRVEIGNGQSLELADGTPLLTARCRAACTHAQPNPGLRARESVACRCSRAGPRPAPRDHFTDAASDPPDDSAALSCSRHARRDAMIACTAERATFHHANGRGSASMLSARA